MPFVFNVVELCVVTINEKPWTHVRKVCKALMYEKKTANIVQKHRTKENYTQKYQMSSVPAASTPVDWSEDSQNFDIYINEEGVYELLFSRQQPKAKAVRKHYCNVLFPHVLQQPSDKSHAMEIEGLTSRVQVLEITNEAYQQAIEEKDAAITLLNVDLKDREHYNVALQAQRDVYKEQLQKCQDIITHLKTRHVPHANDQDNIVMIIEKNIPPPPHSPLEEDEFYEYSYCIARIQRRFINTKRRWFKAQFPIIGL